MSFDIGYIRYTDADIFKYEQNIEPTPIGVLYARYRPDQTDLVTGEYAIFAGRPEADIVFAARPPFDEIFTNRRNELNKIGPLGLEAYQDFWRSALKRDAEAIKSIRALSITGGRR